MGDRTYSELDMRLRKIEEREAGIRRKYYRTLIALGSVMVLALLVWAQAQTTPNPGHPASQISGGVQTGSYHINGSLNITSNATIGFLNVTSNSTGTLRSCRMTNSTLDSAGSASATATCATGEIVTGGGCRILTATPTTNFFGQIGQPSRDLTSYQCTFSANGAGPFNTTATAICCK